MEDNSVSIAEVVTLQQSDWEALDRSSIDEETPPTSGINEQTTRKEKQDDFDATEIQDTGGVETVKQHISQLLVSKYANQQQTIKTADENGVVLQQKYPVKLITKDISDLRMERYAKKKYVASTNDVMLSDSVVPEKSSLMDDLKITTNYGTLHGRVTSSKHKASVDSSSPVANTTPDVEDPQIAELLANTIPAEETMSRMTPDKSEHHFTECSDSDHMIVNEIVSSVGGDDIQQMEISMLPSKLIGNNVTFHEVGNGALSDIGSFSNVEETQMSDNTSVPNIKQEFLEPEQKQSRHVSTPPAKVVLNLSTISKITSMWEKSYKKERKPKKMTSFSPKTNIQTQNISQRKGNVGVAIQSPGWSPISSPASRSEELTAKFWTNRQSSQNHEQVQVATTQTPIKRPKLIQSSSIANKEMSFISERITPTFNSTTGMQVVTTKRKVGRPKKTKESFSFNASKEMSFISEINSPTSNFATNVQEATIKRKVGRPKMHKGILSNASEEKTFIYEKNSLNFNCATNVQELTPKSKVERPKVHKETHTETIDLNNKAQFVEYIPKNETCISNVFGNQNHSDKNVERYSQSLETNSTTCQFTSPYYKIKPCSVKLVNINLDSDSFKNCEFKVDFSLPRNITNAAGNLKGKQNRIVKPKPGRPKKLTSTQNVPDLAKTIATLLASETMNKVDCPNESLQKLELTTDKPCRPKKSSEGRPETQIEIKERKQLLDEMPIENTECSSKQSTEIQPLNVTNEADTDLWEDDWQSEGDSCDDYQPSEEEFLPNKKQILKNVFCKKSKKAKHRKTFAARKQNLSFLNDSLALKYKDEVHSTDQKQFTEESKMYATKGNTVKKGRGRRPTISEHKCKHCDFTTSNRKMIPIHFRECHQKALRYCQFCDFKSRSQNVFLEHEAQKHTGGKPFKCETEGCEYATAVHNDFMRHVTQKHAKEKVKCPKCDFRTKWRRNLVHHDKLVHNDVRAFVCDICNFAFKRKSDLAGHLQRHSDEKPLQCDQCGFRCKTNWEIKSHKLKHSDVRLFPCTHPGCKQACKTNSDLIKHMVVHTTVRKFKCSLCDRSYKSYSQMRKHEKGPLHITARNFHCELCGKAFKTKKCLAKHQLFHKGIKPFKCDVCDKYFSTKCNLATHKVTHNLEERPFHCPICPFGAKLPTILLTHIGSMHGDSYAYYCELCRKPFKRYSQLHIHYRRVHSEKDQKQLGNPFEVDLALLKMEMALDLEGAGQSSSISDTLKSITDERQIKTEPMDEELNQIIYNTELPPDMRNIESEILNAFKEGGRANNVEQSDTGECEMIIESYQTEQYIIDRLDKSTVNTESSKIVPIPDNSEELERSLNDSHTIGKDNDHTIAKDNDHAIGKDNDHTIGKDNDHTIAKDNDHTICKDNDHTIAKDNDHTIAKDNDHTIAKDNDHTICKDNDHTIAKDNDHTIGKDNDHTIAKDNDHTIGKDNDHTIAKDNDHTIGKDNDHTIAKDNDHTIGKDNDHTIAKDNDHTIGKDNDHTIGKDNDHTIGKDYDRTIGKDNVCHNPADTSDVLLSSTDDSKQDNSSLPQCSASNTVSETSEGDKTNDNNINDEDEITTEPGSKQKTSINRVEKNESSILAIYDGFRLPLARKGFQFNYEKRGKKTNSWFMDTAYMAEDAKERQMKYLRRVGKAPPLSKRKRMFKIRKMRGVPQNLLDFVKERRKRNFNYIRRKMTGVKITSEELKEMKETKVIDKSKRKKSFKGSYAEFENLDGEEISITDVHKRPPNVTEKNAEDIVPRKKMKISTSSQGKTVETKRGKKANQRKSEKKSTQGKKNIPLYSDKRRKNATNVSVRKPSFLDSTDDDHISTEETQLLEFDKKDSDMNLKEKVKTPVIPSVLPQGNKKRGRKPKPTEEKPTKHNSKDQYEPVKPKYKYVKRAQQKKMLLESSNNEAKKGSGPASTTSNIHGNEKELSREDRSPKMGKSDESEVAKALLKKLKGTKAIKTSKITTKKEQKEKIKIPRKPVKKSNNRFSISSAGMLHEETNDSQFVMVYPPQDKDKRNNHERISLPGSLTKNMEPTNLNVKQIIEGGKSLMYCDDVAVMKDLHSCQEVFGLSINQIKSETFIEPVEPFSMNQVFKTGTVINPVHPILLTQSSVRNQGSLSQDSDSRSNTDEMDFGVNEESREPLEDRAGYIRERISIQESTTDKEVMQLDYSIVKQEPEQT